MKLFLSNIAIDIQCCAHIFILVKANSSIDCVSSSNWIPFKKVSPNSLQIEEVSS